MPPRAPRPAAGAHAGTEWRGVKRALTAATTLFSLRCDWCRRVRHCASHRRSRRPDDTALAPPSLTANACQRDQVNLGWGAATDNVAVTAYEVERCSGAACTGSASPPSLPAPAHRRWRHGVQRLRLSCAPATPRATPARTRRSPASPRPRWWSSAFTLRVGNNAAGLHTDSAGNVWVADTGFNTGTTASHAGYAGDCRDQRPDASTAPSAGMPPAHRSSRRPFTVPNGTTVRLHFAENNPWTFGVGRRVFSVRQRMSLR